MTISFLTIISALLSPRMIRRFHTKWIVVFSIMLTIFGLIGFSVSGAYQMASAYVGSTFMPMIFGILQQYIGIKIMPFYLLFFATLNIGMLETAYRTVDKKTVGNNNL